MKRNADQSLRKHEREMAQKQSGEKEQGVWIEDYQQTVGCEKRLAAVMVLHMVHQVPPPALQEEHAWKSKARWIVKSFSEDFVLDDMGSGKWTGWATVQQGYQFPFIYTTDKRKSFNEDGSFYI
ncbi:hypothetical protein AV530_012437 [Patagioenas fasciata monilis]|uniref:Uncharacterized protein n=1 Tax=Patagioenas fasciata monilis TaxID=372326 RepID=A0A1V4JAJ8_PATFA|nr:hypothetical protein AV530_012437 [Patagioenas fasciata monilis]